MPIADDLIGGWTAENLIHAVQVAVPDANLLHLRSAAGRLGGLTLRERSGLLGAALLADLPGGYQSLASAVRTAHQHAQPFEGWMIWPVTLALAEKAVAQNNPENFDNALELLAELTGLLTSEFALRIMLRHDLNRSLTAIRNWTRSSDLDRRRLAVEGTRPHLPWSVPVSELAARPGLTIPILDALYRDNSNYVRRSVANHLNDLGRTAPELVVTTAARWLQAPDHNTVSVVRPALQVVAGHVLTGSALHRSALRLAHEPRTSGRFATRRTGPAGSGRFASAQTISSRRAGNRA